MKIAIVGAIHELGWELLQSRGHTIIDISDTSISSLKKELADVSGIVLVGGQKSLGCRLHIKLHILKMSMVCQ